jgi:hypothetical protein
MDERLERSATLRTHVVLRSGSSRLRKNETRMQPVVVHFVASTITHRVFYFTGKRLARWITVMRSALARDTSSLLTSVERLTHAGGCLIRFYYFFYFFISIKIANVALCDQRL